MRHGNAHRKLSRSQPHRKSMLANLVISLIEHEQIVTTLPKAKELRSVAEKMVTLAKNDTLHSRRVALSRLHNNRECVAKLFDTIGPRYKDRSGGYTRVLKAGFRYGDASPMAVIELVERDEAAKGKKDAERAQQAG